MADLSLVLALVALGSLVAGTAAVVVALGTRRVAERAVETARRTMAMLAIPYVVVHLPIVKPTSPGVLRVPIHNGGTVPALGVKAFVWGARRELLGTSEALANLEPGGQLELAVSLPPHARTDEPDAEWRFPFVVVRVDYLGPHGSRLSQWYEMGTSRRTWRLRRLEINPADGGTPIVVDVGV